MIRAAAASLLAVVLAAGQASAATKPKNVILLIGDGMGVAQVSIMAVLRAEKFRLGTMPVTGFATTRCADRAVTDSAASAAALATGFKTNYEMVSVDPATLAPQETVLERAEKKGKATGLVTTSYFFDATPAAFAAHSKHRGEYLDIAQQMLKSGAEVILGAGGTRFGKPPLPPLADVVKDSGYTLVTTRAELDAAKNAAPPLLGVFPDQSRDLDYPDAPLSVLAKIALDRLKGDPEGFFLMIEHEGIDSSSHNNSSAELGLAVRSFDDAIGVALDFAKAQGNTLVVVTADHETGGLRVSETKSGRARSEWSTGEHTAAAVPVFAFGPGSEQFAGWMDNTDIGRKLLALQ